MKKTVDIISTSYQCKTKRRYFGAVMALTLCAALTTPALAAGGDPLTIVQNLSDFIFNIIKAVGVIVLGWGIVQVGMSIQSHDASQQTQGFLCLFGGFNDRVCKGGFDLHWCDLININTDTVEMRLKLELLTK